MRAERSASWCLLLSLIGIGLAGYLTVLHLGLMHGELLGGAICSGSGALNCHAVTSGAWGSVLGMPLSLWGLIGYIVMLALSLLGLQSSEWAVHAATLTFVLALFFVGADLFLLGLMVFVIRFYCLFCLATYAVNVLILSTAARGLGRPWPRAIAEVGTSLRALVPSRHRPAAGFFWGLVLAGGVGTFAVHASTTFVTQGGFGAMRSQMREYVSKQPRVSVEVSTDPAHGPAGAPLQVIEFSDFFCPACQRAAKMNTILFASHRRDMQFIFKNYPLDTSCNDKVGRMVHPGACRVAAASECAHAQGKFWTFHDVMFERTAHGYNPANLDADMERLGLDMPRFRACMDSGQGLDAVKRDIAEGAKAGVMSTPTYILNGLPVAGGLQPSVFEDFVAVLKESNR